MDLIQKAEEFTTRKTSFKTMSERILASREARQLVLDLNEIYKKGHDPRIMELMKRITVVKQKIEKRLKGKPLAV